MTKHSTKLTSNKRWTPPKTGRNAPPLSKHISKWTSPLPTTFYYPPYGGYSFPDTPLLFQSPAEALTWGISRFKRDGLSNAWGDEVYPEFLKYVFVITTKQGEASQISMPTPSRSSIIELSFFSETKFWQLPEGSIPLTTTYRICCGDTFKSCIQTMKSVQDYQTSSNSIYVHDKKCLTGGASDLEFHHVTFLSQLKGRRVFVQLESRFKYMKMNNYVNCGEFIVYSLTL